LFLGDNVLFSAAYGSKGLLRLWELGRAAVVRLLTSAPAVEEARRNLDRPVLLAAIQARATHFVTGDTRCIIERCASMWYVWL